MLQSLTSMDRLVFLAFHKCSSRHSQQLQHTVERLPKKQVDKVKGKLIVFCVFTGSARNVTTIYAVSATPFDASPCISEWHTLPGSLNRPSAC